MFFVVWRLHVCLVFLFAGVDFFEKLLIHANGNYKLSHPRAQIFEPIRQAILPQCLSGLTTVYNMIAETLCNFAITARDSYSTVEARDYLNSVPMTSLLVFMLPHNA